MLESSLKEHPRCPTRSEPWQLVSHSHLLGICEELALEERKRPNRTASFVNMMLYSGLVANIYSRLRIDPSLALYVWNNYISPRIHRVQQKRSKAGDVEGGGSSGQHSEGHREVPHQSSPRVGYGVVGAAMLPAIM